MRREKDDVWFAEGPWIVRAVQQVDRFFPFDVAWCGLFVRHCLMTVAPDLSPPFPALRARPWGEWGEPTTPQLGAIMVFWVRSPDSPFGHVGFYVGEDETHFHVLGGNQRDSVIVERFPKHRLLACRWPAFAPDEASGRRIARPTDAAPSYD
ncbi:MAG: hypothetical protein AAF322_04880 [Pseudomonadota bacterium]